MFLPDYITFKQSVYDYHAKAVWQKSGKILVGQIERIAFRAWPEKDGVRMLAWEWPSGGEKMVVYLRRWAFSNQEYLGFRTSACVSNAYLYALANRLRPHQPVLTNWERILFIRRLVLECVSPARARHNGSWCALGAVLFSIGRTGEMLQLWEEFTRRSRIRREAGACARAWATMASHPKETIRTLLAWAKQDNPMEYQRIVESVEMTTGPRLEDALQMTPTVAVAMASALHQLLPERPLDDCIVAAYDALSSSARREQPDRTPWFDTDIRKSVRTLRDALALCAQN